MYSEYFWMGGMWLFPVIGFIIVILCILFFVRLIGGERRYGPYEGNKNPESALDILNKRYAKGEITKEEYEKIKKDILD